MTQVAYRWGFNHLSRFAADYRRLFGEVPSQTLRRRRRSDHDDPSRQPGWDATNSRDETSTHTSRFRLMITAVPKCLKCLVFCVNTTYLKEIRTEEDYPAKEGRSVNIVIHHQVIAK